MDGLQFDPDDMDEDFVNGAKYDYEKPKRGRGSKKAATALSRLTRREGVPRPRHSQNPLLQYLGAELTVEPVVSKPERSEPAQKEEIEEEEEYESSAKEDDGFTDSDDSEAEERQFKDLHHSPKGLGAIRLKKNRRNIYEGSDSEPELPEQSQPTTSQSGASKRQASSSPRGTQPKKPKLESQPKEFSTTESDSVTESDSDYSDFFRRKAAEQAAEQAAEASETESETEADIEYAEKRRKDKESTAISREAKPQFSTQDQHPWIGPLLLQTNPYLYVPSPIHRYLREYQIEGIRFLHKQWKAKRGGILGDDMGLGKTIQVISFLAAIMQKENDNRDIERRHKFVRQWQDNHPNWRKNLPRANAKWPTCLIIAPSTVVLNWEREFQTWGYFEVGIYTGNKSKRTNVLRDFKYGRLDILVTSFDVALRDIDDLDDLAWSCVIVDEAHRLKNSKSKTTLAFDRIVCRSRFALTGTAIQNNYNEFWTLLDWTNPGALGTKEQWEACISKPLRDGQSSKASEEQIAKARILAQQLVKNLLPNFFIRRTKALIAHQMPKKVDMVVFCPLTEIQLTVYKRFINNCPPPKADNLRYISIFMKLSNHLALILLPNALAGTFGGHVDREKEEALKREAFPDGDAPNLGTAILSSEYCGKLKAQIMTELLREWKGKKSEKNKVLIFSRSVKLLDTLAYHLNLEGHKSARLDGGTKQQDRMGIIDSFNNDSTVFCFLISTLAGGTGLNLTAANKVILFDPNWNPAHDLQAIDRAFRIGQHRDVTVFRLLAAGTIEEHIYRRQIYKQQQMAIGYEASMQTRYFTGIQGQKGKEGDLFGMKNLFSLHEHAYATKRTIERAQKDQLKWSKANTDDLSQPDEHVSEKAEITGLVDCWLKEEPKKETKKSDEIQEILSSLGVKYSHQNEEVLKPSHIEGMVAEKAIKARRTGMSSKNAGKEKNEDWPPKRKHVVRSNSDRPIGFP